MPAKILSLCHPICNLFVFIINVYRNLFAFLVNKIQLETSFKLARTSGTRMHTLIHCWRMGPSGGWYGATRIVLILPTKSIHPRNCMHLSALRSELVVTAVGVLNTVPRNGTCFWMEAVTEPRFRGRCAPGWVLPWVMLFRWRGGGKQRFLAFGYNFKKSVQILSNGCFNLPPPALSSLTIFAYYACYFHSSFLRCADNYSCLSSAYDASLTWRLLEVLL